MSNDEQVGIIPQQKVSGIDQEVENGQASRARAHEAPGGVAEWEKSGPAAPAAALLVQGFERAPALVEKTIQAVTNALSAEQRYFNKGTQAWEILPDYRTQLAAAEFVFKNIVGLPVQRVETKNLTITQNQPFDASSPAVIEAMERALERAKRTAAEKEKRAGEA
jgi:hypothetical protein